ncbi:MAG: tRNA (adenosine(37)-N6)-threonylcarbamoyltransferase complex dimerization subunit type 1 TsaB [Candidimonas sp.]|nr:MAG: tRNA (adenosine(37)-N6)-threonylcarbamoyltransferase complex dimerization subunit type 1 TsaB [Candidimonas sp.]TAM24303.1 MAG: tRNA (adenosine(37)-N6)-threonylcarbamoyltransferase complex dimerization subunit type 1 TsaB [Candidimonas sp.]TAM81220.1 MAG: tRNA (adenosine(37)-N6)-threonylcarbamoyltransferase complex dimerization subunit type 1 TsaB [Candidimonas sp.]
MDSYILALETSSSRCGVALLSVVEGRQSLICAGVDAIGQHAERLLPMVDRVLLDAGIVRQQLSAIGFGQGPGGFTGLRVACGVAQGISYALGLQVLPVASLLAVAAQDATGPGADPSAWRLVVQDARMGEVYLAVYCPLAASATEAPAAWQELCAPILMNSGDVSFWLARKISGWREHGLRSLRVVGDALEAYPDLAGLAGGEVALGEPLRPDVGAVAQLAYQAWRRGERVPPEQAAPLYVRDKVAYTTAEREHGLGGNPKAGSIVAGADSGGVARAISLRAMTPDDLDDVLQIERAVQSFPWTRGNFQDALKAGYGAWVACMDDKVVGCCLALFAPDVGHVLLIAVAPDAQKKGVGACLLACCERMALGRGLCKLILEVRPSNERAIAFYKHHGFEHLSVRKNYYPAAHGEREDAWVLEKSTGYVAGRS